MQYQTFIELCATKVSQVGLVELCEAMTIITDELSRRSRETIEDRLDRPLDNSFTNADLQEQLELNGESVHDPSLTKEQLDRELDEMVRNRACESEEELPAPTPIVWNIPKLTINLPTAPAQGSFRQFGKPATVATTYSDSDNAPSAVSARSEPVPTRQSGRRRNPPSRFGEFISIDDISDSDSDSDTGIAIAIGIDVSGSESECEVPVKTRKHPVYEPESAAGKAVLQQKKASSVTKRQAAAATSKKLTEYYAVYKVFNKTRKQAYFEMLNKLPVQSNLKKAYFESIISDMAAAINEMTDEYESHFVLYYLLQYVVYNSYLLDHHMPRLLMTLRGKLRAFEKGTPMQQAMVQQFRQIYQEEPSMWIKDAIVRPPLPRELNTAKSDRLRSRIPFVQCAISAAAAKAK